MKTAAVVVALLGLAALTLGGDSGFDASAYPYSQWLSDDKQTYQLHWSVDRDTETIRFATVVKTQGWIGFGISPNGKMPSSDVVIGWVDDTGAAHFRDYYAAGHSMPTVDFLQDWKLLASSKTATHTILEFSRKWGACDEDDLPIPREGAHVIWSYHTSLPANADAPLTQHVDMGTRLLNLITGAPFDYPNLQAEGVGKAQVLMPNLTVPANKTVYWCISAALPVLQNKMHIIANQPKIQEKNRNLTYDCPGLTPNQIGWSGLCSHLPDFLDACYFQRPIAGWAVGGETFYYPNNAGYPLSGGVGTQFVLMEVHYDNPNQLANIVDASGMEFYYTAPRQYDAGIMFFARLQETIIIPAKQSTPFPIQAHCTDACTSSWPTTGINVIASFLHAHTTGVEIYSKVIRGGAEIQLNSNSNYDFNQQSYNYLAPELKLYPNDVISLQCKYNTADRDKTVIGGESTTQEMCMNYLVYWPKIDFSLCASWPDLASQAQVFRDLAVAGGMNANTLDTNLALVLKGKIKPDDFFVRAGITWTPQQVSWWKQAVNSTDAQTQYCSGAPGLSEVQLPTITKPLAAQQCTLDANAAVLRSASAWLVACLALAVLGAFSSWL